MQSTAKVVLSYLLTCVLMGCPAWARHCVTVEGELDTTVTLEDFEGTGVLSFNGRNHVVHISGINLGFTETETDGTQHAVTSTDWKIIGNGVEFTTFEDARLEPTDTPGVFLYVGRSRVETGNKRYNCGEAVIQGEVNFNDGVASFPTIRGKLCNCN